MHLTLVAVARVKEVREISSSVLGRYCAEKLTAGRLRSPGTSNEPTVSGRFNRRSAREPGGNERRPEEVKHPLVLVVVHLVRHRHESAKLAAARELPAIAEQGAADPRRVVGMLRE